MGLPLHFWLWSQLPLLPLNMEVMAIITTSLEAGNPYKEDIQNAKSFGKKSKGSTMKKKSHYVKVPVQDTKTECDTETTKLCEDQWVCLDYPKQENLDYCQNKKWQPTNYNCQEFEEEHCHDVPFTRYEDQEKEECKWEHKRVPVQVNGKVAFRECPNKPSYEYTRDEVREMDFSGY